MKDALIGQSYVLINMSKFDDVPNFNFMDIIWLNKCEGCTV